MRETIVALRDRDRASGELLAAAAAARSARLPFPPYSWENPYALLVNQAKAFAEISAPERELARADLEALVDRCLAAWPNVLDAMPPRPKRVRNDERSAAWLQRKDCGDDD